MLTDDIKVVEKFLTRYSDYSPLHRAFIRIKNKVKEIRSVCDIIALDIACARDWLLPGRKVTQVEIDACINELNNIIEMIGKNIKEVK